MKIYAVYETYGDDGPKHLVNTKAQAKRLCWVNNTRYARNKALYFSPQRYPGVKHWWFREETVLNNSVVYRRF